MYVRIVSLALQVFWTVSFTVLACIALQYIGMNVSVIAISIVVALAVLLYGPVARFFNQ